MKCLQAGQMKHWWEWSPFTYPFNLTQQPAAAVPCGFTKSGLPVSMQIVGAKFSDPLVLRAAYAYEMAHPFALPSVDKCFAHREMLPTQAHRLQTHGSGRKGCTGAGGNG